MTFFQNKINTLVLSLIALLLLAGCSSKTTSTAAAKKSKAIPTNKATMATMKPGKTEILWDEWGVPHIYADTDSSLFYSTGWAQMTSHTNLILKLMGKARGRAAEYWGPEYLENDMMIHGLDMVNTGKKWYNQQSPANKRNIQAFARGMNDYAAEYPSEIDSMYSMVLPITPQDIMSHSMSLIYGNFVGGGELRQASQWEDKGSNSYAIAPKRSASGNAMLVMNPHLPWNNEWLFYEAHMNTPDMNAYGAMTVGLPTLGIAFNEHLGWTHTVNTIDNIDRYELTIRDGQYEVDGQWYDLRPRQATIQVNNGAGGMEEQVLTFYTTPHHGHVIKVDGDKALAVKMPGMESSYGMDQWWRMGRSKSLGEFESSLRRLQIPFFNVIYADQGGNIFYLFNGQVPVRDTGDFQYWGGVLDGSKSVNLWDRIHGYHELPKLTNPASGWLQNANDPPWTSTIPNELDPADYPAYIAPVRMNFRPQISAKMMAGDTSITFDELVDYKMSTRVEMADRILDDLYKAIDDHGSAVAQEAKEVLMKWDRHANADSRGMALFYQWAWAINPYKQSNYETKWSIENALTTPDGLADPKAAVVALEGVASRMKSNGVPLDIPWGQVYRIKKGDIDVPGHGADGSVGMYRVAWSQSGPNDQGITYIDGGDSWQAVIEFGDKVKAKGQLSYGNSSQPNSPHYTDQIQLFVDKKLRDLYFYKDDVLQHVSRREVMRAGKYRKPRSES